MLEKESVFLVTNDKAFYEGHDPTKGLAGELKKDVADRPNEFEIFPDLGSLLSRIKTDVKIEPASLIKAYRDIHGEEIENMAAGHSFALEGEPTASLDVFVTENPTLLFVNFTIEFPCVDASDEERTDARIVAHGEGTYDADAKEFTELASRGEKLSIGLKTERKRYSRTLCWW